MPKFDDLQHLIEDLGDCPMVLGLSETWLDDTVGNSEISVEGHRLYRRGRHEGRGGGLLLYVTNRIESI